MLYSTDAIIVKKKMRDSQKKSRNRIRDGSISLKQRLAGPFAGEKLQGLGSGLWKSLQFLPTIRLSTGLRKIRTAVQIQAESSRAL